MNERVGLDTSDELSHGFRDLRDAVESIFRVSSPDKP